MSLDPAHTREPWSKAQINLTLAAYDRDLHSILFDPKLSGFEKEVLVWAACESFCSVLERLEAFS